MSGALPADPADLSESAWLELLHIQDGNWKELVDILLGRAERAGKQEKVALLRRVSALFAQQLGDGESAFLTLSAAFRENYSDTEVAAELERLTERLDRWRELITDLTQVVNDIDDRGQAADLWVHIGLWYDRHLSHAEYAAASVQQALAIDPAHRRALTALAEIFRRNERWTDLAATLAQHAALPGLEAAAAVDLRLELAELREIRLGDEAGAVEAYESVIPLDARNRPALAALGRLYEKTGRFDEYLAVLERELEVAGTDAERIALHRRLAATWEEQGWPDRAAQALEKILAIDSLDERAFLELERIYRQNQAWDVLVDVYRKHLLAIRDPGARTSVAFAMGKVCEEDLGDLERAAVAYADVLASAPGHAEALGALARIHELTGRWSDAVEMMQRLLRIADDARMKVELHYRIGLIQREQLHDPASAEEHLSAALGLDPSHVGAMLSLIELYRRRGDWLKAAQLMLRAEGLTPEPSEKAQLLFDAATIFQDRLDDVDRAAELYARTLQVDPQHRAAAESLSEIGAGRQEWATVISLVEMLLADAAPGDPARRAALYARHAKAAAKLGDAGKALESYQHAYDADPQATAHFFDWAILLSEHGRWGEACQIFDYLLTNPDTLRSDAQVGDVAFRLASGRRALGDGSGAVEMLRRVLAIDPGHREALTLLADVQTDLGDFRSVLECKRALLRSANDPEARFALCCQIGEISRDKLQDPRQALAAYLDALELKPAAHQILHEVLELLTATHQWKDAVEVLLTLADLGKETDKGKVRARYLVAAGNILNYELHGADQALDLYNQALDEDPEDLKTFERIDRILTAKKDWKEQERNYRRMIKRLGPDPGPEKRATQVALWRGLGEICRSRLGDLAAATMAFEVCAKLDASDLTYHRILGELYGKSGPAGHARAIEQHVKLLRHAQSAAERVRELRALRRLYLSTGQYDRAWCVGAALVATRGADAEEMAFHQRYRVEGFIRPLAPLTEEQWQRHVFHSDEDRRASQLFAGVSQAVALVRAKERKEWGLRPKDRQDPAQDKTLFSRVVRYATSVLGLPRPDLYLLPDVAGAIDMANVRDQYLLVPTWVVGSSLLSGRSEKDLACVIGKKLALMRPDHFILSPHVVPTTAELRVVLVAVLRVLRQDVPIEAASEPAVARYVELLQRAVHPQAIEQIGAVLPRLMADPAALDLHRWANAVDLTANRAALLVSNDLELVVRYVEGEPVTPGGLSPAQKTEDLIRWAASEEYFGLREHLGQNIDRR